MKTVLLAALAASAALVAAPVSAAITGNPCNEGVPDPNAIACISAPGNQLNKNSEGDFNSLVDQLLSASGTGLTFGNVTFNGPNGYNATKDDFRISGLSGDILNFREALLGYNVIGVHFGSAGGSGGANNQTLLYLFNFASATSSVDLNRSGFSDDVRVSVQSAVPEPGTWALMLLGFGAVGFSMRRQRRAVPQLA